MLVIIVILIGLIQHKKKLIYIAIGLLYILSTPIFSNNFFKLVEGSEYRKPISVIDIEDAIVVLSGMLEISEWGDPDRFFGGMSLFKAGKAQKLVFTGGKMPWNKAKKTEGEVLRDYAMSNGIATEKIFITKDVENTADEAVTVKELISPNRKIILVTSAVHMYRAKRLFEKQGFEVIVYKVDYKAAGNSKVTVIDFLPSAGSLAMTETGMREIIGDHYYYLI